MNIYRVRFRNETQGVCILFASNADDALEIAQSHITNLDSKLCKVEHVDFEKPELVEASETIIYFDDGLYD